MPENAMPGYRAIMNADANAASAPIKAIAPSGFWLRSGSSNGSTTMMIMPKIDSTNSGSMPQVVLNRRSREISGG